MVDNGIHIRGAKAEEADFLTALAMRSKAYWGYSREFMDACRAELTVSPERMGDGGVRYMVAELDARVVGYYGLARRSDTEFELEALFVDPAWIGRGVGRALVRHALAAAAGCDGRAVIVQGDPNAERFYRAAGGIPSGSRESESIPGRYLPLFTIPVDEEDGHAA